MGGRRLRRAARGSALLPAHRSGRRHSVAGPARDAAGNHTAAARERARSRGLRPPQSGCTPTRAADRFIPTMRMRAAPPPLAQAHAPPCGRPRWRRQRQQPRETGRCESLGAATGNGFFAVHRCTRSATTLPCGDVAGDGADGGAWHVAAFRPDAGIELPDGVAVREIADAGGAGLVDTSGLTLYAFAGNAAHPKCDGDECTRLWLPLEAPAIANPVGNFSPLARDDGITQWMYRGKPLYKFAADRNPQDVNGSGVDSRFRVALVLRFFLPADATIRRTLELGDILAIAERCDSVPARPRDIGGIAPVSGRSRLAGARPLVRHRKLRRAMCQDLAALQRAGGGASRRILGHRHESRRHPAMGLQGLRAVHVCGRQAGRYQRQRNLRSAANWQRRARR